jgi:hypothetical protein
MQLTKDLSDELANKFVSLSWEQTQDFLSAIPGKKDSKTLASRKLIITLLRLDENWNPTQDFTFSCLIAIVAHGCKALDGLVNEMSLSEAENWRKTLQESVIRNLVAHWGISAKVASEYMNVAENSISDDVSAERLLDKMLTGIDETFSPPDIQQLQASSESATKVDWREYQRGSSYMLLKMNFGLASLLNWRDVFDGKFTHALEEVSTPTADASKHSANVSNTPLSTSETRTVKHLPATGLLSQIMDKILTGAGLIYLGIVVLAWIALIKGLIVGDLP